MTMKPFAIALVSALLVACAPGPSPTMTATPSVNPSPSAPSSPRASPAAPSPSLPTSKPAETAICAPETRPLPSALRDPCPSAIAAIRAVVEPLGQPIARIYLEPDPFECEVLWPGIMSPPPQVCMSPLILPGRWMHGWVSFSGTDKVAAVELARDLPVSGAIPSPVPPWKASVVAFIVPPAGWSMP
jgi:hypothetical protein